MLSPGTTTPSAPVVFVGGCERSGTTLVAHALASTTAAVFLPEAYFLVPALLADDETDPWETLTHSPRVRTWGLSRRGLDRPSPPPATVPEAFHALVDRYAGLHLLDTAGGWVEHTPANLRHVEALRKGFPGARFVNVIRDGRSVFTSIRERDFGPSTASVAANWWMANTLPGIIAADKRPDEVATVRYEDLTEDPVHTLEVLTETLGLSHVGEYRPDPVQLDPYTRNQHALVGAVPDASRNRSWEVLAEEDLGTFEAVAGSVLEHLGYPLALPPSWPRRRVVIRDQVLDAVRQATTQPLRRGLRRYRADLTRLTGRRSDASDPTPQARSPQVVEQSPTASLTLESRLPDFILIGAMRAGTTSLHRHLSDHPEIGTPVKKELDYFVGEESVDPARYARLFRGCDARVVGEASPSYAAFPLHGAVSNRMAEVVPDVKILYLLRDPVERMRSHYRHEVLRFRESRPADEALDDATYLVQSLYGTQLEQYLEVFDPDQIAVVSTKMLTYSPHPTLEALFRFLGVDPTHHVDGVFQAFQPADVRVAIPAGLERLRASATGRQVLDRTPPRYKHTARTLASTSSRLLTRQIRGRTSSLADLVASARGWSPSPTVRRSLTEDAATLNRIMWRCHVICDGDQLTSGFGFGPASTPDPSTGHTLQQT